MAKKGKKKTKAVYVDDRKKFGRYNIFLCVLVLIVETFYYYFATPAINIQNPGFILWLIITIGAALVVSLNFKAEKYTFESVEGKATKPLFYVLLVLIAVFIIAGIASSQMLGASKYSGLIQITDGDFETDIPESREINDIALMDTDTARIIGERAIGSLSDVVSQYEVSDSYSTIDYNGRPMKVASLEYAGFI